MILIWIVDQEFSYNVPSYFERIQQLHETLHITKNFHIKCTLIKHFCWRSPTQFVRLCHPCYAPTYMILHGKKLKFLAGFRLHISLLSSFFIATIIFYFYFKKALKISVCIGIYFMPVKIRGIPHKQVYFRLMIFFNSCRICINFLFR